MGQAKHQGCVLVLIQWEVLTIIDRAELHTVVVDHTKMCIRDSHYMGTLLTSLSISCRSPAPSCSA